LKIFYTTIFLFLVVPAFLSAQTAARIEQLLETQAVDYEKAAQLVLEAAGITDYTGQDEAFNYAHEQGWLPKNAAPDGEASLAGVSLLIMRSFRMRGGIMYTIFSNPHYAYRELAYREVIQGRATANMAVSGEFLLFMVNRLLYLKEEGLL